MKISVVLAAFSWMATTCQAFQSTQMPNNHVVTRHHPSSPMIARKEPSKSFSSTSSTSLQASPLTALTSSPLGAVTVLASVVIVHEAGHYLAARLFGINVTEFSIGFGPKLFGFEALGNEFNLRGLPLGGYVRFPENYNVTELQEKEKVVRQAYQARVKDENWSTVYELFNLATLGFWDQQQRRKKFAAMNEEYQTLLQENAQKPWWTQLSGRPKPKPPAGDPEEYSVDYFEDPSLLQNRPWFERAVVLSGGVIFNMILAFSIYFGEINLGSGLPQPVFDSGVIITQTPSSTSASVGVLRQGDVILGINGKKQRKYTAGLCFGFSNKVFTHIISSSYRQRIAHVIQGTSCRCGF